MMKLAAGCFMAASVLAIAACQPQAEPEQTAMAPDKATSEQQIWAMEAAIFKGRGEGDLSNYLAVASPDYLGWPPVMRQPMGLDGLRANASQAEALRGEKITFVRNGFTTDGHTAVTYFTSHRTRLGDGFAPPGKREVDEYYENTHIWSYEDGKWRLIGGMARKLPPEDGRVAD